MSTDSVLCQCVRMSVSQVSAPNTDSLPVAAHNEACCFNECTLRNLFLLCTPSGGRGATARSSQHGKQKVCTKACQQQIQAEGGSLRCRCCCRKSRPALSTGSPDGRGTRGATRLIRRRQHRQQSGAGCAPGRAVPGRFQRQHGRWQSMALRRQCPCNRTGKHLLRCPLTSFFFFYLSILSKFIYDVITFVYNIISVCRICTNI